MAFFFRNKQSKFEIVKTAKDLLIRLRQPPQLAKTEDELCKLLSQMKVTLQGTHVYIEVDTTPEAVSALVNDMIKEDFIHILTCNIHLLRFEARKDSQTILSYALRFRPPGSTNEESPALAHVLDDRPETAIHLCRGYERKDSAMPCGAVLREILKNEHIAALVLYDESQGEDEPAIRVDDIQFEAPQSGNGVFWQFFDWINNAAFEASTDAFSTFRTLLTTHKPLVAHYLHVNFVMFFSKYNSLLIESMSYVTKRQSIKLLGEILLDRTNYVVMTHYVELPEHLKLTMKLLKDERKMVQYEGFHVFKVFVANPNKSEAVTRILTQNRDRLLRFLPSFLDDRQDDDQFLDEKSFLIRQIELLPAPATVATT
ncbi:uncharacterized protein KY384_007095 [Bacidia gigantensis]|uniref:uncharacterized protein n=1 Tax=Bacidia gigantensis TaxID=2732470 RepID=UPI001D0589F1|nr:uncharacterized protein KY384_007095 [Bacidia gigantensis]KAG8528178.1 hypothetical protein KY384_007095 [Bacidia gigantensis]